MSTSCPTVGSCRASELPHACSHPDPGLVCLSADTGDDTASPLGNLDVNALRQSGERAAQMNTSCPTAGSCRASEPPYACSHPDPGLVCLSADTVDDTASPLGNATPAARAARPVSSTTLAARDKVPGKSSARLEAKCW